MVGARYIGKAKSYNTRNHDASHVSYASDIICESTHNPPTRNIAQRSALRLFGIWSLRIGGMGSTKMAASTRISTMGTPSMPFEKL